MKVGTDGILLGAWVALANDRLWLDVGAGCGLLSVMLAQRQPTARIWALELDPAAAAQATENFLASPWPERLWGVATAVQTWEPPREQIGAGFDHLVSNPPFFRDNSSSVAASNTGSRVRARSHRDLSPAELWRAADRLVAAGGRVSLIVPWSAREAHSTCATADGWCLSRLCAVRPLPSKSPHRALMTFARDNLAPTELTELTLETEHHVYTPEFQRLTADFYLPQTFQRGLPSQPAHDRN